MNQKTIIEFPEVNMFFVTHEKSHYQLMREYLECNSFIRKDFPESSYIRAMASRCQEFGFDNLESYCRYVLLQSYRFRLEEIRSLILTFDPPVLYQPKDVFELINSEMVYETLQASADKDEKPKDTKAWIMDVLTTEIKLKSQPEKLRLNLLCVESSTGEEAFSAAMRLKSILSDMIEIDITAMESDSEYREKSIAAIFNEGQISGLHDNYRSLYLESADLDRYRLTDEIKKLVKLKISDILSHKPEGKKLEKYHIILCTGIFRHYPCNIAHRIIKSLIPMLAPGALLFAGRRSENDAYKGLDRIEKDGTIYFRRNADEYENISNWPVSYHEDSMENRLHYIKSLFFDSQFDKALEQLEKILNEDISNIPANLLKGDIYVKQGLYDKAARQYSRVLIIDPGFLPARYNTAASKLLEGKFEEARSEIEMVLNRTESFDYSVLPPLFNIDRDIFLKHTERFKTYISATELVTPEKLQAEIDSEMIRNIKVPEVEVKDKFGHIVIDIKETHEAVREEQPAAREVVNISELPSTRDYGDEDPWKKKLEKDAEKLNQKKAENEFINVIEEFSLWSRELESPVKTKAIPEITGKRQHRSGRKVPASEKEKLEKELNLIEYASLTGAINPAYPIDEKSSEVEDSEKPKIRVIVKSKRKDETPDENRPGTVLPADFQIQMERLLAQGNTQAISDLINHYKQIVTGPEKQTIELLDKLYNIHKSGSKKPGADSQTEPSETEKDYSLDDLRKLSAEAMKELEQLNNPDDL